MEDPAAEDERSILISIYDSDPNFVMFENKRTFQYTYGNDTFTFLIELHWPEGYPSEADVSLNLENITNKRMVKEVRDFIYVKFEEMVAILRGTPMTYSVIEGIREIVDKICEIQVSVQAASTQELPDKDTSVETVSSKKPVKLEKLTKAQKRKQWDRGLGQENRPRGWNWVDVIKHLSQTGSSQS